MTSRLWRVNGGGAAGNVAGPGPQPIADADLAKVAMLFHLRFLLLL